MMDQLDILQIGSAIGGWLSAALTFFSPFEADSRFHWTGLSAFILLGTGLYLLQRRQSKAETGNWVRFLFPPALYSTQSSWVDVKVYFANRLIKPLISMISLPVNVVIMTVFASLVMSTRNEADPMGASAGAVIMASLLVAILFDLAYYVTHRVTHESDVLWPFHKLHHSAEVLTPITAKRNHPVFNILLALVTAAIAAPVSGAIYGLFGVVEFTSIFGLTLLIAVMNVTGGALRHSHIWLGFGPVLSRIFISPAQHQIHHSMAVRHHDKNYGLTLAIWDWMFGTLYVPAEREELEFGVADRFGRPEPQVHSTLKEAYLVPFQECGAVLQARSAQTEETCS